MHVLTLLLILPLLGSALLALLPDRNPKLIRSIAIAFAGAALALSWGLISQFDLTTADLQFSLIVPWNPRLGTSFALGVDGFSLPMVLLATLLCFLAILASAGIRERVKGYYMVMLVLESAMLGVFMAQDWSLFYLFWEFTLIPLFFLIDRWGGAGASTRHRLTLCSIPWGAPCSCSSACWWCSMPSPGIPWAGAGVMARQRVSLDVIDMNKL